MRMGIWKNDRNKVDRTEVGNTIDLYTMSYGDMENEQPLRELVSTVQIGALTDEVPMGIHTVSLGGVNIIVSEDTMDQLAIASEGANPYADQKVQTRWPRKQRLKTERIRTSMFTMSFSNDNMRNN